MFLLVNLEDHITQMGEIVATLVNNYSVPISIVDRVEKLCPKCGTPADRKTVFPANQINAPSSVSSSHSDTRPEYPSQSPSPVGRRTFSKQTSAPRPLDDSSSPNIITPPISETEERPIESYREDHEQKPSTSDMNNQSQFETTIKTMSNGNPKLEYRLPHGMKPENVMRDYENLFKHSPELETLNPSLLACLLSTTPNVFSGNRLSPSPNANSSALQDDPTNGNRQLGHVVSSTGKVRRGRIVYNSRDLAILEQFYNEDPNACADPRKKKQIMDILGVDALRVKVWFQNRRRKDKLRWLSEVRVDSA